MRLNDKNYPYPILVSGSQDYNNSSFNIEVIDGPREENNNILIGLQYSLKCTGLEKLLNQKKITIISQIYSRSTSFRKYYSFDENKISIVIDKGLLGSKVEIYTYITSNEDIKEYFSVPVKIQKGDKLGFAEMLTFDLKPYDSLRPIASIVVIKEDKRSDVTSIDVDLSNDKIFIYLNSDLYDEYRKLREFPDLRLYLSVSIVMPAIIEALYEIKNNQDLGNDKRWVSSINRVLKKLNIDLYSTEYSCYSIANMIFKNGLETSLISLEKFYNIDDKES
jgi:hypothetical protein